LTGVAGAAGAEDAAGAAGAEGAAVATKEQRTGDLVRAKRRSSTGGARGARRCVAWLGVPLPQKAKVCFCA
jgi:hypothetical protein